MTRPSPAPTRRLPRAALLGALCALGLAAPQARSQTPPAPVSVSAPEALTVHIDEPSAGVVHAEHLVTLRARVSDPTVTTALLTAHGMTYEVPVTRGEIVQEVVVLPGNNRVGVTVQRGATTARDSLTFFVQGEPVELVVLLSWASRHEIIDLWVREPDGETCKWDHRETAHGGQLLDFSQYAIGFGAQAYIRPRATAGRYRVKVHYWALGNREGARTEGELSEALAALHDHDRTAGPIPTDAQRATRAALEARLRAWARPAATQTPLHAEVLLFPNTPFARRWRFALTAQRDGQLQTLGEVDITDAMLREARAVPR